MKYIKFNENWMFWEEQNAFALVWNIPKNAKEITIPHDAMLLHPAQENSRNGGNTGFHDGAVYNYVNILNVPEEYETKVILLKFEGIYENAFVYVNGQAAGKNPYGYSTFYVNIKDYLNFGADNEIRVVVKNGAMVNSRWYSGGGIYQDVYLCLSNMQHIIADGVKITTESLEDDGAIICVETEIENLGMNRESFNMETYIYDKNENVVAEAKIPITLFTNEKRKMKQHILIEHPNSWSDKKPYLYTCHVKLTGENPISLERIHKKTTQIIDEEIITFGIRTMTLDAKRGLRINGKTVKLRGACIHHDSGLLGAATYEDAQYRQISILKSAGFNAIRMSHQPIAAAMLRVCDELGMYVMDETFDMWTRGKSDYDYSNHFAEYWEKDVEAMIHKDYNHPSVILYSVGNEIPEIGTDLGAKICYEISTKIKSMDQTRYTLAAINGAFAVGDIIDEIVSDVLSDLDAKKQTEGNVNDFMTLMDSHLDEIVVHPAVSKRLEKACAATDIAGYNYMTARYELDGKNYPNRVIVGSETYPPEIARNWNLVKNLNHVIGDFTWTGWDYIGEAGVGIPAYQWGEGGFGAKFPAQLAYVGDIDLTGYRRPASYFREIVFGLRKKPYIAVQNPKKYGRHLIKTPWVISDSLSCWNYKGLEGNPVIVEVYSPGDEVELFINNRSLGKKPAGNQTGFITQFETVYENGILRAVAYDKGISVGEMKLSTPGENKKLTTKVETGKKDGLYFVLVEVKDEKGVLVMEEEEKIQIHAVGVEILGFGSADPKTAYSYQTNRTKTYHGRVLAILKKVGNQSAIVDFETESRLKAQVVL